MLVKADPEVGGPDGGDHAGAALTCAFPLVGGDVGADEPGVASAEREMQAVRGAVERETEGVGGGGGVGGEVRGPLVSLGLSRGGLSEA